MKKEVLIRLCMPQGLKPSLPLEDADWGLVAEAAKMEGLSGVVYASLGGEKGHQEGHLKVFKESYYSNIINNLCLFNAFKPVLACLREEGIAPIVFRGASLMGDVYPSFGMRGFQDIDLLLREGEFSKTSNLLKKEGFNTCDPYICVLYNGAIYIDLHTDFMTYSRVNPMRLSFRTDIDSIFERALEKEVQGVRFLVPHPEDGLLSLAVHSQMHSYERLLYFLDIARFVWFYRDVIDWERLFRRARDMNLDRTLYYSLFLMPEEWRTFDPSVINGLTPRTFYNGERLLLKRLKRGQKIPYSGDTLFLLNVKGILKRLKFLKGVLFPQEEVGMKTLLNPFTLFGFLIVRFLKIWRFLFDIMMIRKGGTIHG